MYEKDTQVSFNVLKYITRGTKKIPVVILRTVCSHRTRRGRSPLAGAALVRRAHAAKAAKELESKDQAGRWRHGRIQFRAWNSVLKQNLKGYIFKELKDITRL